MKLLTNKQDPRNRIIVVDAYINGDRIVCDANSDDFDLWEDCWTIEDLEDEPINPFDTKLFQDGVKREDERIMKIITDSIFYGAGVEYKDVLDYLDYLEKLKEQEHPCDSAQFEEGFKTGLELGLRKKKEPKQESGEKGVKGPQEIGDWRGDEGVCKKQKEQPQVADASKMEQEVDLVKAIDEYFGDGGQWKSGFCVGEKGFLNIARHFYELGKARKEE